MKRILVLGASNSRTSINHKLANFIASQVENIEKDIVFWDEIELPLYSPQLEDEIGIPEQVKSFKKRIKASVGIVISLAEHNGMPTAAFKNLWDWCSRVEKSVWADKPMFLAATSPGGRGASSVLEIIDNLIPHYGGNVIATFSLPKFKANFSSTGIVDEMKSNELTQKISTFKEALDS